jgi:mannose-6-phosphate isomerase-like protein (cupin superfamily)
MLAREAGAGDAGMQDWIVGLDSILARLEETQEGKRFLYPIRHGSMRVGVYAPRPPHDPQQPHDQDELYIVIGGTGIFRKGEEQRPFRAGDVILVEAGVPHRFEGYGEDFATWVVFWGPKGGEAAG